MTPTLARKWKTRLWIIFMWVLFLYFHKNNKGHTLNMWGFLTPLTTLPPSPPPCEFGWDFSLLLPTRQRKTLNLFKNHQKLFFNRFTLYRKMSGSTLILNKCNCCNVGTVSNKKQQKPLEYYSNKGTILYMSHKITKWKMKTVAYKFLDKWYIFGYTVIKLYFLGTLPPQIMNTSL